MKSCIPILIILICVPSILYPQNNTAPRKQYNEAILKQTEELKEDSLNSAKMYNLACLYSLSDYKTEALKWLEKAIRGGYTDYISILRDTDLNRINSLPEFGSLTGLCKQMVKEVSGKSAIYLKEKEWKNFELKSSYLLPKLSMSMEYDADSLRIHSIVQDNHFKDKDRAWRYGDGFFINFAFPSDGDTIDTDKFIAFGFSLENKKPVSVLVNKDGEYFLKRTSQVSNQIKTDSMAHQAEYRISIPWSVLYPFSPLMHQKAGINIIYVSQNDDGSRKILKYIDDPFYDTESTNKRRFAPLLFAESDNSSLKLTGEMESRLVKMNPLKLKAAVYSPVKLSTEISIIITDSTGREINEKKISYDFDAGRNVITCQMDIPEKEGIYNISLSMTGAPGWKDSFYMISSAITRELREKVKSIKHEGNKLTENSMTALNYYVDELEQMISGFNMRKDPLSIKNKIAQIKDYTGLCIKSRTIYNRPGLLKSAFISKCDSSVQPFAIYLPEGFDPGKWYNLIVALHGSGVDENGTVTQAGREFCGNENIVIGPRGRGLSSWYTGKSEEDVASLIETAKEIFNISKTFLYGFSMGGYGTWRISFLYSELLDGSIIISGIPFNLLNNESADNMNSYLGNAKHLPFLVIHGTEDRSLDIKYTDEFIGVLEKENYQVEYKRIPGGGHGNFRSADIVKEWLSKQKGEAQ